MRNSGAERDMNDKPKLIRTSDLRKQAEEMLRAGTMPTLEEVLRAVGESRKKYIPLIRKARSESK